MGVPQYTTPTFTLVFRDIEIDFTPLTDIRRQYIIELWRAPKGNMNVDGWGSMQQTVHIHECVNSDSHNLT